MGVDHGERVGQVPQEFRVMDVNANSPPDFVKLQNFKHQIARITE